MATREALATAAGEPSDDDLLTLDDAISRYGVSRSTLYRYVGLGLLMKYGRAGTRATLLDRRQADRLFRPYRRQR